MEELRINTCKDEWKWQPEDDLPDDAPPKYIKDSGIDFIVYNKLDNRVGNLFLLGQCACGKNWESKTGDISKSKLNRWFRRTTYSPFNTLFAIPFCIPNSLHKDISSERMGVLLDRMRLTKIYSRTNITIDDELENKLTNLISLVLDDN